jgi:hypothetical protein
MDPSSVPHALDALIDAAVEIADEVGLDEWNQMPIAQRGTFIAGRVWDKGYTIISNREAVAGRLAMLALLISIGGWVSHAFLDHDSAAETALIIVMVAAAAFTLGVATLALTRPTSR